MLEVFSQFGKMERSKAHKEIIVVFLPKKNVVILIWTHPGKSMIENNPQEINGGWWTWTKYVRIKAILCKTIYLLGLNVGQEMENS